MIGCLRTRVRNQPIIALYFESENVLKLYNLEARNRGKKLFSCSTQMSIKLSMPYMLKCQMHKFRLIFIVIRGILRWHFKIVGILAFISMIYTTSESSEANKSLLYLLLL